MLTLTSNPISSGYHSLEANVETNEIGTNKKKKVAVALSLSNFISKKIFLPLQKLSRRFSDEASDSEV